MGNSYTGVRPISGSDPLRSAEERLRGGWRLRLELNLLSLPISDIAELIDTLRSHRFVTAPEVTYAVVALNTIKIKTAINIVCTLRFIAAAYPGGTPTQTE